MKVLAGNYRNWEGLSGPTAVTIGVYDGVHLGHQSVVQALVATGLPVVVLTFRHHPVRVISPEHAPKLLTSLQRRLELLQELGVSVAAVVDFDDDFRLLPAEEFVEKILVATLRAERIAVGKDFRFGHQQLGNVAMLRAMGDRHGFAVDDVEILEEGVPVRSTVIRALLKEGHARAARRLLGRPYRLFGKVVPGDQRGRAIGFPTANLDIDDDLLIPGSGVFAARAGIDGITRNAVVNIGRRPTFGGNEVVVEAHVLDFTGDLYDRELSIDFIERLRSEQKFAGVDDLVAAIGSDIEAARKILEES